MWQVYSHRDLVVGNAVLIHAETKKGGGGENLAWPR